MDKNISNDVRIKYETIADLFNTSKSIINVAHRYNITRENILK